MSAIAPSGITRSVVGSLQIGSVCLFVSLWRYGSPIASGLTCEYLSDPLGIDVPAPRFAWILNHSERAEGQTAYQILVSSTLYSLKHDQGDQWDSTRSHPTIRRKSPIKVNPSRAVRPITGKFVFGTATVVPVPTARRLDLRWACCLRTNGEVTG